jgi:hypothetical protein
MTTYTQVTDTLPRVHYVANGVQTAFPFTFPVFDAEDMEVWINNSLQLQSVYSVSGIGVAVGGTVIFTAPPPPSTQVTLRRRMALKRTAEFPDTAVEAKPLNDALYYQMAALQQVADDCTLAVKRSFRSLSSVDLTLPEPAAGRAIRWNDSGDGLTNSTGDVDTILPQAQAQAGAAAASAIAASISQTAASTSAAAAVAAAAAAAAAAADLSMIKWQGAWSAITAYGVNDVVSHDGSSWICIQAHTNQIPTTGAYWDPLAAKGNDGVDTGGASTGDMLGANNLSDLASAATARTNLGVYSTAETNAAIAAAGPGTTILSRIAFLERNLAVNTLRDQVDTGWSILKMVDGIADEFEDETGIGTNVSGIYDSTGDYYHNFSNTYATDATSGQTITSNAPSHSNLYNLIDDSTGTTCGSGAIPIGTYIQIQFSAAKHIRRITMQAGASGYAWQGGKLQWSDNGSTWTDVGNFAPVNDANKQTFDFAPSGAHIYWRITSTNYPHGGSGYGMHLAEIEMIEMSAPASITLVSQAFTATTTPVEARLVLLHQPVDSTTLGTDCTIEVSRNGGTTWTAGTLSNDGAFDGSTNILSATIDLTAQPTGTAMKWRFKTFNAKNQRLHGVWLQWR